MFRSLITSRSLFISVNTCDVLNMISEDNLTVRKCHYLNMLQNGSEENCIPVEAMRNNLIHQII